MVVERITAPRLPQQIYPERRFPILYVPFELPPARKGASPTILKIKKSKESAIMQLFVDAQKKEKPVYLSEIKDIYNPNPQNKTKHSMALTRSLALGAKNNLDKILIKQTPWTIFSSDFKPSGNHGYEKDNPAFYLITKRQAASKRRRQKEKSNKKNESLAQEENQRKIGEPEDKLYTTIVFRFTNDTRWLPKSLGELSRKIFTNGLFNPFLGKSKNEVNRYFADKFRRRLEAWWDIEDTGSISETEQQAVEYCKKLRDRGYTAQRLLEEVYTHFDIPFTSSPAPEFPKG